MITLACTNKSHMGVLFNSINTDFFRYLNKLNVNCSQCDCHVILKFFSYSNNDQSWFYRDWNISESQFKNFYENSSDLYRYHFLGANKLRLKFNYVKELTAVVFRIFIIGCTYATNDFIKEVFPPSSDYWCI